VDVGLVNSSRGIIFAGEERAAAPGAPEDAFATAAGQAARRLKERLNAHR
jgi:orotidine-5'-phosphate decarboxylase